MRNEKGFTLIEAAVAIAVVAILSGIIVPLVVKNIADSQRARAMNDVQVIAGAIASQMKDTGTRPNTAAGPGAATGVGQVTWQSANPATLAAPASYGATGGNQTFTNLFTAPGNGLTAAQGNTLFGLVAGNEFSYRGPYLGTDVALKTDPWGAPYMIYGYNATSQTASGPIWVVSGGPDKFILAANVTVAAGAYPAVWSLAGASPSSADDIVVRVN